MPENQQTQQSKEPKSMSKKQSTPIIQTPISNSEPIIQRAIINPKSLTSANVLQLQSLIGNRAVGRLLSVARYPTIVQHNLNQCQEILEKEEPLQMKKENNTGMPDNLKASVESLSGIDMNDVRVHYNSSKPAEIGALAYTRGTDIHVAPGQERHLPHEAWHVVQQAQGRVKPTIQAKGVLINDDEGLEREAGDMRGREVFDVRVNNLDNVYNNSTSDNLTKTLYRSVSSIKKIIQKTDKDPTIPVLSESTAPALPPQGNALTQQQEEVVRNIVARLQELQVPLYPTAINEIKRSVQNLRPHVHIILDIIHTNLCDYLKSRLGLTFIENLPSLVKDSLLKTDPKIYNNYQSILNNVVRIIFLTYPKYINLYEQAKEVFLIRGRESDTNNANAVIVVNLLTGPLTFKTNTYTSHQIGDSRYRHLNHVKKEKLTQDIRESLQDSEVGLLEEIHQILLERDQTMITNIKKHRPQVYIRIISNIGPCDACKARIDYFKQNFKTFFGYDVKVEIYYSSEPKKAEHRESSTYGWKSDKVKLYDYFVGSKRQFNMFLHE